MTLNTPLLFSVNAFDPSYSHTFEFAYSGIQAVANRAIITDNATQTEVYNRKQDGLRLNHVVPANILKAGKSYLIQIQVYDADGNFSNLSEAMLFYCFTTPQFYFSNVNNEDVISEANLTLKLNYSQEENELLNEYKYYIYDAMKELIYTSDSFFTDNDLSHTIYDLKNDNIYYVRAIGTTTHGINLDTGMLQIAIKYNTIPANISFEVINDNKKGCIVFKTNIVTVGYETLNDNYTIDNGLVKLFDNTLTYEVASEGDFCLIIKAKQLPIGKFCWTTDESISISIECIANKYYCHLCVNNGELRYDVFKTIVGAYIVDSSGNTLINSDKHYISIVDAENYDSDSMIVFQLYRKNNIYDITASYA